MRIIKAFFIVVLCFICLAWISLNAFDVLQRGQTLGPSQVFSKADQEVWILNQFHHPNNELPFKLSSFHQKIMLAAKNSFDPEIQRVYFSKGRVHFLVESTQMWTKKQIQDWCNKLDPSIELNEKFFQPAQWGPFKIKQDQNYLWFTQDDITLNSETNQPFQFDQLANFTKVELLQNKYTDFYLQDETNISYLKKSSDLNLGEGVNDFGAFAAYTPENIDAYTFYSSDYLSAEDPEYQKGWMKDWTNSGVLITEFATHKLYTSDFLSSNDPQRILAKHFELSQLNSQEGSFMCSNQLLGKASSSKPQKYFFQLVDNVSIICKDQAILERYCANIIQGATLMNKVGLRKLIYTKLPQSVHYREWKSTKIRTRTIRANHEIEVQKFQKYLLAETQGQQQVYQLSAMEPLSLFNNWNSTNVFWLLNKESQGRWYNNDTLRSTSNFEAILGNPQSVSWENENGLLYSDGQTINIKSEDGSTWNGFPMQPPSRIYASPIAFANAGELDIVYGDANGVLWFLHQRKWTQLETGLKNPTTNLIKWNSAGLTFIGWQGKDEWMMIEADARRIYREYELDERAIPVLGPNEISHFIKQENKLIRINQKGERLPVEIEREFIRIIPTKRGLFALHEKGAVLIDETGFVIGEWEIENTNEIDFAETIVHRGELFACFLNTVSNKVILFRYVEQIDVAQSCDNQPRFHINERNELYLALPYQEYLTVTPVLK